MIDSTNPRVMADNIRQLAAARSGGSTVVPNPEGAATANLNKLGIDDSILSIPEVKILTGTVEATSSAGGSSSVEFASALPDTNYLVCTNIEDGGVGWAAFGTMISGKTTSGFTLNWYNGESHEAAVLRWYVLYVDGIITPSTRSKRNKK